jgi:hypothetical protein
MCRARARAFTFDGRLGCRPRFAAWLLLVRAPISCTKLLYELVRVGKRGAGCLAGQNDTSQYKVVRSLRRNRYYATRLDLFLPD